MFKTIDLFAGIGGIRRGFELTGQFTNVLSAEIDYYACLTYENLFGENPYNDVTSNEFLELVKNIEYDVLLAGFPCQAFSRAGLKKGFKDETRGKLFYSIEKILKITRPKAFFLENVDNLLSHNEGKTINTILEILITQLNYKIIGVRNIDHELKFNRGDLIRNSRFFGVPQNRKRMYLLGFNKELFKDAVNLLPDNLPVQREKPIYNTLEDLLEKRVCAEYYLSTGYLETLKRHKSREKTKGNNFGFRVLNLPEQPLSVAGAVLATGGSGHERNIIYQPVDEYSGLIIPSKRSPINNEGLRFMTPLEWGRLQGFVGYAFLDGDNDRFQFPPGLSNQQKYKQLGNSVTIPVIEELANFMLYCLKKLSSL